MLDVRSYVAEAVRCGAVTTVLAVQQVIVQHLQTKSEFGDSALTRPNMPSGATSWVYYHKPPAESTSRKPHANVP